MIFILRIPVLFLLLMAVSVPLAAAEVSSATTVTLPNREHPFLYADAATFAGVRDRAARHSWARTELDRITTAAEQLVAQPLEIPSEGGQWGHYYICKECSAELQHRDGKHVCTSCKAEHTGWPFDQVVAAQGHRANWLGAETLGLAWALTGDERYAARAREILLAYAQRYEQYPYHDYKGGTMRRGARIFAQTLDESVSGLRIIWAYDLIHNSPLLTPADHQAIEHGLLRPLVETIRRNDMGISNWQTWHNALIAAVGFVLEDAALVSEALEGPHGLRWQLENGVLADGFWHEGAIGYHYYTLDALRWTAEAARAAGLDHWKHPAYQAMYDAPLRYTFPDLWFPAVNDSALQPLAGKDELYEIAYACFRNPAYLTLLNPEKRNGRSALLWGIEELPAGKPEPLLSHNFEGVGAAVLRQGAGDDQIYVHLDYGPHGGGHGHHDKLALIVYALGQELAPDPGTVRYSSRLYPGWYKTTFAHNTLVVDGKNQAGTQGRLTHFSSKPGFAAARAECDTAYKGVRLSRTVLVTDKYLVDVCEADSDTSHTYDWLWHNHGELTPSLPVTPRSEPLGAQAGYQHFKNISEGATSANWSADFREKDANIRLTMLGGDETSLYFGTGLTGRTPKPCPMLVARRTGEKARFVTVLEPYRKKALTTTASVQLASEPDGSLLLTVKRRGTTDSFRIPPAPGGEALPRPIEFTRRQRGEAPQRHVAIH